MSEIEALFWTLAIIGGATAIFAVLAGLAELCEWAEDFIERRRG